MGQIVSSAAKPKRCNKNKLSQLGVLAAGLHVLVSSDNSMNAAGQGNFDCYIVGDGTKAAEALPLKYIASAKNYIDGYKINTSGGSIADPSKITSCRVYVVSGETVLIQSPFGAVVYYDDNNSIISSQAANGGNIVKTCDGTWTYLVASFTKEGAIPPAIWNAHTGELLFKMLENFPFITDADKYNESKCNYIIGFSCSTAGISGLSDNSRYITKPIKVSKGDVLSWDSSLMGSAIVLYNAAGSQINFRNAVLYSSWEIPEDSADHVIVPFSSMSSNNALYINGKIAWKPVDIENLSDIVIENAKSSENVEELAADLESEVDSRELITKGLFTDGLYSWYRFPILNRRNYNITSSGKLGTNSGYEHNILPVVKGMRLKIQCETTTTRTLYCALLSSNNYEIAAGSTLPLVEGTSPFIIYVSGDSSERYVTIPEGCHYIALDNYYTRIYLQESALEPIPEYYREYIRDKAFLIRKRDIQLGLYADSFIFLTDYHYDPSLNPKYNFGHSPVLVKYLQENTNTKRFMFGGDILASPSNDEERFENFDTFLKLFSFTKFYPAVGNHEWRQSSNLGNDGRNYDFGSVAKMLERDVTFGRNSNGELTQPYYFYDNPAKKIRYFVLYTPGTTESGTYAVFNFTEQMNYMAARISEMDSDWKIVIMQHIVYENSGSTYDNENFPISVYTTDVGSQIKSFIATNNAIPSSPKIVCLLSGHYHNDFCEFLDEHCVSVTVGCDATYQCDGTTNYKIYPNNSIRMPATVNEQLFDVMHVDVTHNIIYSTRIGYGYNKKINITNVRVQAGSTTTLTPAISGDSVTWISQNENVATVSNGVITGVAAGRVTIKASANTSGVHNGEWEYFNVVVSE